MWMPILLICSSVYAESCWVVTRNKQSDMLPSKEECFEVSIEKAKIALKSPTVYRVKPMCQEILLGIDT